MSNTLAHFYFHFNPLFFYCQSKEFKWNVQSHTILIIVLKIEEMALSRHIVNFHLIKLAHSLNSFVHISHLIVGHGKALRRTNAFTHFNHICKIRFNVPGTAIHTRLSFSFSFTNSYIQNNMMSFLPEWNIFRTMIAAQLNTHIHTSTAAIFSHRNSTC